MIITEYQANALNKKTEETIDLGVYISEQDAWDKIINGIDWQPETCREDWFFQVIDIDVDEDIISF